MTFWVAVLDRIHISLRTTKFVRYWSVFYMGQSPYEEKFVPLINVNSRNQDMLTLKRIGFLQVLINKFRPFNLWHWGLKGRQIIAHCFEHEEEYKITQYYIFLIHRLSSLLSSLSKWSPPSSLYHCRWKPKITIKLWQEWWWPTLDGPWQFLPEPGGWAQWKVHQSLGPENHKKIERYQKLEVLQSLELDILNY